MQIKFLMVFADPLEQEYFPSQWVFLYLSQRFSGFHQAFLRKNIQIASCIYTMEYDMLEKNKASHQYMPVSYTHLDVYKRQSEEDTHYEKL